KEITRRPRKTKSKNIKIKEMPNFSNSSEEAVFEYLKNFRRDLARSRRTKPFKIFPDKTLLELASKRPTQLAELESIYGVGPKKLKRFGKIFLDALSDITF
ncbi:MAG: HRDC domain-containing protein, partial [Bdellovibrionales bacterium]|nr:HRDC domain-containing protein [Bdellovibrionales bacterium]